MEWSEIARQRHSENGWVYIAGSKSLGIIMKVGMTTTDIWPYEKRLNRDKHGDLNDWRMLYRAWHSNAGEIESDTQRKLLPYKTKLRYIKNGSPQRTRETFFCSFTIALKALEDCCCGQQPKSFWRYEYCNRYES